MARLVARVDAWQRRHALGGFPIGVVKKFGEDDGLNLAALIAYYAFVSLFPLLLAFVSILGFVLEGNPSLRDEVVDTTLGRIPVIGAQLHDQVHPLTGSGIGLVVGLVGALWASLGVTLAFGRAFAQIWDVPRFERPNGVKARLRGLAVLVILGLALVGATAAAGLASGSDLGAGLGAGAQRVGAIVLSLAFNAGVFLAAFALLTPKPRRIRDLLPGVAVASVAGLLLQSAGAWYVTHAISGATATYGTFALVIGLLLWFWVGSNLLLLAAEANVVLRWRLWPRSLSGELEEADRAALTRLAGRARVDTRERIAVSFGTTDTKRE
jgi:YihY family inner membrane protein